MNVSQNFLFYFERNENIIFFKFKGEIHLLGDFLGDEHLVDESLEKGNDINAYYKKDMGRDLFSEGFDFQVEFDPNFKKLKQRYTLICKLLKTVHKEDKCSSFIKLFEEKENVSNSL